MRVAVAIDSERADGSDGIGLAFEADLVVAHRGADRLVVHEFFEHVDRCAGVGMPLGVGVSERVGMDEGLVKAAQLAAGGETTVGS